MMTSIPHPHENERTDNLLLLPSRRKIWPNSEILSMVDPKLLKHWVLKNKLEDGTMTYTPKKVMQDNAQETEEDGIELKEDGTFIKYIGSHTGHPYSYTGEYEIVGDTIRTYFEAHYLDTVLKIEKLEDNLLQII